jgi:aspartyl-tRNA(Asn)/glutamyl-tRNA(Gln) amidotransferase subunit A
VTDLNGDPQFLSIHELSAAISAGALTSSEIVERCLAQIERHQEKLHAFVTVYAEDARTAATAADQAIKSGHYLGPLHGIPVALKDIVDLEGRITTGGSEVWRRRVSPTTATLAQRLIGAGMIVIGKTHSVEFAMGGWGTNTHLGTPWNPWDPEVARTPGGSSSGSGVAVASGMVPGAIGTDTGGSVRLPASYCGLTGLKTTVGRISTHGVLPLSSTLDTPGPMVRSVHDAALMYDAMHGPDPLDAATLNHMRHDPFKEMRLGVEGLRLGIVTGDELDGVEPQTLAAYQDAARTFEDLGANVREIAMPRSFSSLAAGTGKIIAAEGYRFVGHLVDDEKLPVDPNVVPRISVGRDIRAHDYLGALAEREEIKAEFEEALSGIEALLMPTTQSPAIPLTEVDEESTPAWFTRGINYLDMCALSLPNGFSDGGLPLSLQIACRGYDEALALRIGWAFQQATDWHKRHPDLS